jgi:hypothetical protein
MSKRINLMLTDEAYDKLMGLADSVNTRGKKVSELIMAAYEMGTALDAVDNETLRLQLMGLAGSVRQLEGRLLKVEAQLAAVIAHDA